MNGGIVIFLSVVALTDGSFAISPAHGTTCHPSVWLPDLNKKGKEEAGSIFVQHCSHT